VAGKKIHYSIVDLGGECIFFVYVPPENHKGGVVGKALFGHYTNTRIIYSALEVKILE
jgi:hypothetical protein